MFAAKTRKSLVEVRVEQPSLRTTWLFVVLSALLLPGCVQQWSSTVSAEDLPASLLGLGVAPDRSVVSLGEGLQFVATGYYSDQETRDLTDVVEWQSWRSDVLRISSSMDYEGFAASVSPGNSRVRARYLGLVSNELRVTVTDAVIEQLTVAPLRVELHGDQELQLVAEAAFSDGSRGNVSGSVRWITDNPGVVTAGPTGRLEGRNPGTARVRAVYETSSGGVEAEAVVVEVLPQAADLDPADLRFVSVQTTVADDVVTWSIELENVGERAATDIWVDVWLDRTGAPPAAPTAGDVYQVLPFLAGGAESSIQVQLSEVGAGQYDSWLLVDSLATNFEGTAGESNNTWGPEAVSVAERAVETPGAGGSSGAPGPEGNSDSGSSAGSEASAADLEVTYFEAWSFTEPDEVLYFIDVMNQGSAPSGAFDVAVYGDLQSPPEIMASADVTISVDPLGPGQTDYLSAVIAGLPSPAWTSFVLADVSDVVDELLEANNLGEFLVTP